MQNRLLVRTIFLYYFLLCYCVIDSYFKFYGLILLLALILAIIVVAHCNVMVVCAYGQYVLFVICCVVVWVEFPGWVQLLVEYLEPTSGIYYIVLICSLNSHHLLFYVRWNLYCEVMRDHFALGYQLFYFAVIEYCPDLALHFETCSDILWEL